jgi:hypothetical protein
MAPLGDAAVAAANANNINTSHHDLAQSNHLSGNASGDMDSAASEQGGDYGSSSSSRGQRRDFAGGDDLAVAAGVKVLLCLLQ